jgi:ABC-2 type transport system ATP-binding protein
VGRGGCGVIEVAGARKVFGRVVAVEDVSFTVRAGEIVGLVGPNGSGKSTTIRMIAGGLQPTAGAVRVAGIDVVADPAGVRRKLGYVPEDPRLYEYLTGREMLEFVVAIRGGGQVEAGLDVAGLGDDADRLIHEYSQGMRRKTALAAALVSKPPALLLDEALNGLDPPSAARAAGALRAAAAEGAAVLLSTHALEALERLADRVVLLDGGRVKATLPAAEMERVREMFGP